MENKQDQGFTLVELLIVIVILGILATVTVFAVRGITDQGQDSACAADQKTMETALESYFAQKGVAAGTPTEQDLVDAGFLVAISATHEITGTVDVDPALSTVAIEPIAGGDCA
jgi:prepilin-type N-terminal cleavage/methylation domain-containing protein